jgi:signal transduction histidine kinase
LAAAYRAFRRQLRLSELKSNFVSSVSHELRAPIASVRLMAESLERGKIADPSKQHEYFRFIVQECRRLSSLIENVLDFSRIEQGRKQFEFEPIDIVALTRQTVKLMQAYATERQVALTLVLADNVGSSQPQLSADGKAVQQALINLIDNAVKHSPKGQTVTIGLDVRGGDCQEPGKHDTWRDQANAQVQARVALWVEDRGEGIPPDEHAKIFERFYRLGSELRRETQGVGIGLSIVKHVVEAHGGRVLVVSSVGKGSRFTLELPCGGENLGKPEP